MSIPMPSVSATRLLVAAGCLSIAFGCAAEFDRTSSSHSTSFALVTASIAGAGATPIDRQIEDQQRRVIEAKDPAPELERLGFVFVEKARSAADAGYYHLALECAAAMEVSGADPASVALLRGHALHALHRFPEAEEVARDLAASRGIAFDFGLLGDVLLDRGDVEGAADAYQRMMDLKPDSRAFARAAELRFAIGDVEGAALAMASAARSVSPRRREAFAWTWARLARYELELAQLDRALRAANVALDVAPDSAPAWFQRARAELAMGERAAALESLRRAAAAGRATEVLWALSDLLDQTGGTAEALALRAELRSDVGASDPRALSLFLATTGGDPGRALELANDELASRRDAHTWDALAWAQRASGDLAAATESLECALAFGIRDARLYFHAGVIAAESGDVAVAAKRLDEAAELRHTLLPSERMALDAFLYTPRATKTSS